MPRFNPKGFFSVARPPIPGSNPQAPTPNQGLHLWLSLALTLLFFGAGFCFWRPFFVTGDDPLMTMIAQGGGEDLVQPSEFLVFSNVVLGLCLKALYTALPFFHWYGLFHLAVFFVSMFFLVFLAFPSPFDCRKLVLLLAVFSFEFFHYFCRFEFTLTAFWAAQAGVFLLLDCARKNSRWERFLFCVALFLVSALIRVQGTLLAAVVAAPLIFFEFRSLGPSQRKNLLTGAFSTTVLILSLNLLDNAYYGRSPGWKDTRPYLSACADLMELRQLDSNPRLPQILDSGGWDYLDFVMFKHWFWQGPQFGIQRLDQMISDAGTPYAGKTMAGWQWLFRSNFLLYRLVLLAFFLFFMPRNKYFLALLNFLFVIVVFFCLFYFQKTVSWVVWPIFSYMSFLCLYYAEPSQPPWKPLSPGILTGFRGVGWAIGILWVWVTAPVLRAEWMDNRAQIDREKLIETDIKNLAPTKNRLYVIWDTLGGFPLDQLSVLGNYDLYKGFPIYFLNWEQATPRAKGLLGRFQIRDLPLDMVGRKDVFFILPKDFLTLYGQYMREHYQMEPAFNWVFHGNTFDAYQVTKEETPQGP